MRVCYEWDIEFFDVGTGDITDHNHAAKLTGYSEIELWHALTQFVDETNIGTRLVLVRDEFGKTRHFEEDLIGRSWAYVRKDMTLPETADQGDGGSENGFKVPARFRKELADAVKDTKEALGHD